MLFPIQKEESLRELLFKKNLELISGKKINDKYLDDLLDLLFKSTRFNDVSDIIRIFDRKNIVFEIYFKTIENLFCSGIYIFHYPIIRNFGYFIENFLDIFKFFEKFPLIQKNLNSLLLSKKKFHLNDFLIKKLSIKNLLLKNDSFGLVILNHETLLARKIYNVFQSYSNWFQMNLEKQYKYRNYKSMLNFSIGKISLAENKYMKAFSIFIEAIEELDKSGFKNKLIIIEWFIFSSSLLKKKNPNLRFLDEHVTFNTKNLLEIKALHYSIQTNNLILWENIIFKAGSQVIHSNSMYPHVKKFFKNVNKQIKQVLSIFARLSLQQFSKILGVSLSRVELILSYYILNGVHRGYFDCTNKTYVVFFKMPPQTQIKIFMEASVKLASIMNLNIQKKNFNVYM